MVNQLTMETEWRVPQKAASRVIRNYEFSRAQGVLFSLDNLGLRAGIGHVLHEKAVKEYSDKIVLTAEEFDAYRHDAQILGAGFDPAMDLSDDDGNDFFWINVQNNYEVCDSARIKCEGTNHIMSRSTFRNVLVAEAYDAQMDRETGMGYFSEDKGEA